MQFEVTIFQLGGVVFFVSILFCMFWVSFGRMFSPILHQISPVFFLQILLGPLDSCTPPQSNMEPENDGFQMDFPFPGTYFQVPC